MSNITVITPFFNEEETLRFTIDALLRQSLRAERILMVDSGSNDSSAEIIKGYINSNHMSIELLQPMLGSQSSSINYTIGTSNLDKSLIAHTYGYKNRTICLPGSLMDTSIFKLVGVFEENVRAGYDVDFINRIKKHGIQRVINDRISLKYIGTNYAKNYIVASRKVFNYSLSGWKTKGDYKPFAYVAFLFIILSSIVLNSFIVLSLFYIIIRGYCIPYIKSKNLFEESNLSFYFMLPISAIVFDISRTAGYLASIKSLVEYGK